MNDTDFGKVLRKMRTDSGKTVQQVSDYLTSLGYKAATQTVYGWERGLSQPNPDPFLAMCKFYGVTDIFAYFGGEPTEAKKSPSTVEAAPGEQQLVNIYRELNEEGRDKLVDYADDLVSSGKYIKSDKDKMGGEKLA